jgi:iron complex outermembrane recepter protein
MSDVTHRGDIAGLNTTSTIGINFNNEWVNAYTYNVMPGGAIGALTQTVFGHQLNVGARAASEITLAPRWKLLLDVGWEFSQIDATEGILNYPTTGPATATNVSALRNFNNVAPAVALVYAPIREWQLHTRVSTGYGTPIYSNLFTTPQGTFGTNTQLQPQTDLGIDVGAKYTVAGQIELEVTGFYEFYHNELVTQSPGASLQSFTFNAPASQHRGVEVGGTYRPLPKSLPGASLTLAYIYDDQIYTDYVEQLGNSTTTARFNRAGNMIPGVPPNELFARINYEQPDGPLKGLGGHVDTIFRGAAYLDNANLVQAPSYAVVNVAAYCDPGYTVGPFSAMHLFFEVDNLFNKTYVASANNVTDTINTAGQQNGAASVAAATGSIYAGSPRAFYGGVKLHF